MFFKLLFYFYIILKIKWINVNELFVLVWFFPWVLLSVLKLNIVRYLCIFLTSIIWEFSLTTIGYIQSKHLLEGGIQIPTEQRLLVRRNLILVERKRQF